VTHAVEVLDDGHLRLARDAFDQALSAARHDDVDVPVVRDQMPDRGPVRRRDELHGVFRQAGGAQAALHARGDRLVAAHRFGAAAQDRRVARLEAEAGRIGSDVGPRFVDDADDAERHAHAADLDAGRTVSEIGDLAHGIGQRGDGLEPAAIAAMPSASSVKPVDEGVVVTIGDGRGDILRIGGAKCRCVLAHGACHGRQRGVLRRCIRPRDIPAAARARRCPTPCM
jgi:hypothetical protein